MTAIAVLVDVTPEQIAEQFVTAFEGGSNYWLCYLEPTPATRAKAIDKPWYACPKVFDGEYTITFTFENPNKGAEIISKVINETHVLHGLKIMAEKYGRHFHNLRSGDGDAETADVFLQCVLFGEIVFG